MKVSQFYTRIAKLSPELKIKLTQAGMTDKPEEFVKKAFVSSGFMAFGATVFLFFVLSKITGLGIRILIVFPIIFMIMFFYMFKLPDVKINKKSREVEKEIVFAARFLIIELESGVPLYNAMQNISKNFESIGKYFSEITNKVDLGTSMEDALNEAVELAPSNDFKKILWQIINSMRTGSNVGASLVSVVNQISKDQATMVNKYGKKLNPLAMFYLMIAIILPSLGITMLIILASFIQLQLSLSVLMVIAGLLGFIQFMFISMVKFSRPAVDF